MPVLAPHQVRQLKQLITKSPKMLEVIFSDTFKSHAVCWSSCVATWDWPGTVLIVRHGLGRTTISKLKAELTELMPVAAGQNPVSISGGMIKSLCLILDHLRKKMSLQNVEAFRAQTDEFPSILCAAKHFRHKFALIISELRAVGTWTLDGVLQKLNNKEVRCIDQPGSKVGKDAASSARSAGRVRRAIPICETWNVDTGVWHHICEGNKGERTNFDSGSPDPLGGLAQKYVVFEPFKILPSNSITDLGEKAYGKEADQIRSPSAV
ncbi:hypothetical protein H6P81_005538 [Aristolochia fimbriata]|uniref:Uncharacterized protein n=1 Tax=Aristolochia fimbriata TaxID=158543 RepID=A0AAV7EW59_ARIFI|nr:hypothetical protein H6P81_005538 [Aristolochia fimbriata]